MPQVVEAHPLQVDPPASGLPDDPEVARTQSAPGGADEEGSVALGADEAAQVVLERRHDRARHVDLARVAVLRGTELEPTVVELVQGALDQDGAGPQVDVLAVEAEELAPAQGAPAASVTAARYCSGMDWVSAATWSTLGMRRP